MFLYRAKHDWSKTFKRNFLFGVLAKIFLFSFYVLNYKSIFLSEFADWESSLEITRFFNGFYKLYPTYWKQLNRRRIFSRKGSCCSSLGDHTLPTIARIPDLGFSQNMTIWNCRRLFVSFVWCGVMGCGVVGCGVVGCCGVGCGGVWYGVVWWGVVWWSVVGCGVVCIVCNTVGTTIFLRQKKLTCMVNSWVHTDNYCTIHCSLVLAVRWSIYISCASMAPCQTISCWYPGVLCDYRSNNWSIGSSLSARMSWYRMTTTKNKDDNETRNLLATLVNLKDRNFRSFLPPNIL
jgi:hypothetical protein